MPPRRRSTPTRRPRVAGLTSAPAHPDARRPTPTVDLDEPRPDRTSAARRPAVEARGTPTDDGALTASPTAAGPSRGSVLRAALATRSVLLSTGALVVFLVLAVLFAVLDHAARSTPAARNTALTDVAATAEVAGQLGDALETVYSFDFARLDENERAARAVLTPNFAAEFDQLFAQVRELAPQQQAVVSATVTLAAVQTIDGDRAVLVAFMDQQATRVSDAEQLTAAGRLTVTGERVDGRWKISTVHSH
ncbi:MAG: hypothetical protein ACRDRH_15825 [Pseudonocardia sp.]